LPAVIAPEGWDNWGNTANEQTAYFAEYKNNGDGSNTKQRATWTKNISEQQSKAYTLAKIFSATPQDNWFNIATTKSFDLNYFNTKHIEVLPLYAAAIPNATAAPDKENSTITDILRIAKVSKPTMTLYKPDKPNGKAVIICPGGGYGILAWEKEGTKVAEMFNSWGITAFVLKYRLPDDTTMIDKSIAPLQDAQQAIRLVRSNAAKWNINPRSIGIMGFSAGGHLASTAATHFSYNADHTTTDTTSVRPDFAILLYPVVSFDQAITHKGSKNNLIGPNPTAEKVAFYSNELQVTASTPPSFLVHAGDDGAVPVENSVRYYLACIKNKVPVEMHLYPKGGHGFGLNNATTTDIWMDRMHNWLNNLR
jgi:acetyl esterase/lipase